MYIYNNIDYNSFQKTCDTLLDNQLFTSKTLYPITCFRIVSITTTILDRLGELTLENVTLALGFMTNLVLLNILNQRGVHQNSERPTILICNRNTFVNLQRVDQHQVIQTPNYYRSFTIKNSRIALKAQVIAKQIYQNLAHTSLEVITYV